MPYLEYPLRAAIEIAARDLPEGFQITLHIEKGSGWVSLEYPGAPFAFSPDGADKSLSDQILECVEKAKQTPVKN